MYIFYIKNDNSDNNYYDDDNNNNISKYKTKSRSLTLCRIALFSLKVVYYVLYY